MALSAKNLNESVQVKRTYAADPEKVFAAWSDPVALEKWFGPTSHTCKVEQFDFKENGSWLIRMIPIKEDLDCGGDPTKDSVCAGKFIKIVRPSLIVMSFTWIENGGDIGDTTVTIEIKPHNTGSEVILTHENLPNQESCTSHESGWTGTLECLEQFLS